MIIQVHDELIFDALESEKEELINLAKNIIESTIELSVPIKAEVGIGTNWFEAK